MKKVKLINLLNRINRNKKSVLGYGASTKGNVILQFCKINSNLLSSICEVNKDKNNCYTPGSKIKIISEKLAKKIRPDYYFVLPWHFKKFIIQKEKKLINKGTKFIFPLPRLRIY